MNFDLERMKTAVAGPFVRLPSGLTREQMRKWLIDSARDKKR